MIALVLLGAGFWNVNCLFTTQYEVVARLLITYIFSE